MKVHTHEHYGKYKKAGSEAHVQHAENDSRQNAPGANRSKEQQQPSKRRDRNETAQAALSIEDTMPAVLRSGITQTSAAVLSNRSRSCPRRPTRRKKRCNVPSRFRRPVRRRSVRRKRAHLVCKAVFEERPLLGATGWYSSVWLPAVCSALCPQVISGAGGKTGAI